MRVVREAVPGQLAAANALTGSLRWVGFGVLGAGGGTESAHLCLPKYAPATWLAHLVWRRLHPLQSSKFANFQSGAHNLRCIIFLKNFVFKVCFQFFNWGNIFQARQLGITNFTYRLLLCAAARGPAPRAVPAPQLLACRRPAQFH